MSVIYYKFKAAKDTDYKVFTFDGPSAGVFDVKKEIIRAQRLGKGYDFDLALYNAQADEEYKDDAYMIPRNTSVIWRRLPPARPGKGTAFRYVQGAAPESRCMAPSTNIPKPAASHASGRNMVFDARQQQMQKHSHAFSSSPAHDHSLNSPDQSKTDMQDMANQSKPEDDSEEALIQAMLQQETDQWGALQESMAEQQYIPFVNRGSDSRRGRGGFANNMHRPVTGNGAASGVSGNSANNNSSSSGGGSMGEYTQHKQPPPNYVCYRCGQKGHFINQCPTNGDRDYDNHPRIKRTTGIPKSFLKVIDAPENAVRSGTGGLMVTPTGEIVVAQADSSAWNQHVTKAATAASGDLSDWYDSVPVPEFVRCTLCQNLMREASITICCGSSFCDECIRKELMDREFNCPECQHAIPQGLDGIMPNMEVRQWIDSYVRLHCMRSTQGVKYAPSSDDLEIQ
ncbi:DWNN-domain-containing protein [Hesseltinella vesiculosa]|uniref:DWNN-domain-containing protein n=1 Tax=Hesseltinella vesiculosa TaxID=101127 RepID=A0A1X2GNJ8_9FUNG|nr:DWNN-domain-containing protein [Hesseltinella vesiculosa]